MNDAHNAFLLSVVSQAAGRVEPVEMDAPNDASWRAISLSSRDDLNGYTTPETFREHLDAS